MDNTIVNGILTKLLQVYIRLIRNAPENIFYFVVDLRHFSFDPSFCLAQTRFEKSHLLTYIDATSNKKCLGNIFEFFEC